MPDIDEALVIYKWCILLINGGHCFVRGVLRILLNLKVFRTVDKDRGRDSECFMSF